jgi:RND superfamily putative drug exporter
VLVGGNTAEFVDLKHSILSRAPIAIAIAALTTVAVLFLLTGSVVLAVKALILDALGLMAALGLLVLIFQHRLLGIDTLFAYNGPSAIETTAAVVMIASTFGLTTDYSILLLSRIVEQHAAGAADEDAVAVGIERSGPVITRSALLLAVALLALTSSRVFLIKELTVGQVLGIVIDVTVVRLLLVPAAIKLLGRANWWAPASLRTARLAVLRRLW